MSAYKANKPDSYRKANYTLPRDLARLMAKDWFS